VVRDSPSQYSSHSASLFVRKYKFFKIGTFYYSNGNAERRIEEGIFISERLPLIYAMVLKEEIMYIGETIQGYRRPLKYHTNEDMPYVRNGILNLVSMGHEVNVFARTRELEIEFEGLVLNLRVSLEAALIKKYTPSWNKKVER
jgi:hypothetical protein